MPRTVFPRRGVKPRTVDPVAQKRVEDSLDKKIDRTIRKDMFRVLESIGRETIRHSKATHTFNNRSGNLHSGYSYVVAQPGENATFTWKSKDGGGSVTINNDNKLLSLFFGNGVHYAKYVEVIHGFDVSVQTFMFLRRKFTKIFKKRFKGGRV